MTDAQVTGSQVIYSDDLRAGLRIADLLERAVGREPRARIGAGDRRRRVAVIVEVGGMRYQHVVGIAAVDIDPDRGGAVAELLVAALADRAFAAADPGIDDALVADRDAGSPT